MGSMQISLTDLAAIAGLIVVLGGIINTVFLTWLRSRYVPRSFLFCPKNGTPIYRTIEDCKKMEEELKNERREKDEQIEKQIQEKVETIEAAHAKFTENLMHLFKLQTAQITEAVRNAIGK